MKTLRGIRKNSWSKARTPVITALSFSQCCRPMIKLQTALEAAVCISGHIARLLTFMGVWTTCVGPVFLATLSRQSSCRDLALATKDVDTASRVTQVRTKSLRGPKLLATSLANRSSNAASVRCLSPVLFEHTGAKAPLSIASSTTPCRVLAFAPGNRPHSCRHMPAP